MLRLFSSIYKEILIVSRDKAGLAILFLMPVVLIIVMTLIQDSTFRKLDESHLEILFLNNDKDSLGLTIEKGINSSGFFHVTTDYNGQHLNQELIYELLNRGKYQIGIIIPEGATQTVRKKVETMFEQAMEESDTIVKSNLSTHENATIFLYFDPAIKNSFKQSVRNAIQNFTFAIEAKLTFDYLAEEFSDILPSADKISFDPEGSIKFEELYATNKHTEIMPNSVQHNVPAWAVFAMFFILIPLTGNIIKERDSGSAMRLEIMPSSYLVVMVAKVLVYIIICLIQFFLMLLVGMFFLPLFGLPVLVLGPNILALTIMALATALAATSYGILLGAIASTHDQAASFGSVSVIVLAAIGGIWVPVFIMPRFMQEISIVSPLNWGLEGFYNILLRGEGIISVLPYACLLLGFSVISVFFAYQFRQFRKI